MTKDEVVPHIVHRDARLTCDLQIEEVVKLLRVEIDREREERGYFQLERDKVNTFWDITKKQLEESKATIRNKERELEETEERHQVEIKVSYLYVSKCSQLSSANIQVYKQKVKHLLYEHQNNITELKRDGTAEGYWQMLC